MLFHKFYAYALKFTMHHDTICLTLIDHKIQFCSPSIYSKDYDTKLKKIVPNAYIFKIIIMEIFIFKAPIKPDLVLFSHGWRNEYRTFIYSEINVLKIFINKSYSIIYCFVISLDRRWTEIRLSIYDYY